MLTLSQYVDVYVRGVHLYVFHFHTTQHSQGISREVATLFNECIDLDYRVQAEALILARHSLFSLPPLGSNFVEKNS